MDKNFIMKNLQKEIRSQEKLAQQISEKTAKLKNSKETTAFGTTTVETPQKT